MSYRHYETEAFILSLYGERGANREVFLLSRELGPIRAHAQGLRHLKSKLRYSLQPPARSRVVLVRGRESWRIVGAEPQESLWLNLKNKKDQLSFIERLFSFLERILVGEEADKDLFSILDGVINRVFLYENIEKRDILAVELIAVARFLKVLGYLNYQEGNQVLDRSEIIESDINFANDNRKDFLLAVNAALKATHL